MADGIVRIVGTVVERAIRYIYAVTTCGGYGRTPQGRCRGALARNGSGAACGTVGEWVLSGKILFVQMRESCPGAVPCTALGIVRGRIDARIVVDDDLRLLHVALARQQDVGAGIFEHRYQERQDVALRIEILYGLPQTRALPAPLVFTLVEIPAVALPKGDMTAIESGRGAVGRREPPYQRLRTAVGKPPPLVARPIDRGHQLVYQVLARVYLQPMLGVCGGQTVPDRIVHRNQVIGTERIV